MSLAAAAQTDLNSLVAGLMCQLTDASATADRQARDLFENYQLDPVLAAFPTPRVSIREATVKLRFAIVAPAADEQPSPPQHEASLIRQMLPGAWLDGILRSAKLRLPASAAADLRDRLTSAVAEGKLPSDLADRARLVTRIAGLVNDLLPPADGAEATQTRAAAVREATRIVVSSGLASAEAVAVRLPRPVEYAIAVTSEALADVPDQHLQELTLTFRLDEIAPAPVSPITD